MKRIFIIAITLFLSVSLFADGKKPLGKGSIEDPYQVADLDNLLWFSTNDSTWASHFVQTATIDAEDTHTWNQREGFSPIGKYEDGPNFTGSYNGNNNKIYSLFIDRKSDYQGLFGYINRANIDDLSVEGSITGNNWIALVVGCAVNSTIKNCYSSGKVTGLEKVAGLIGSSDNSHMSNCHNSGNIIGDSFIGGLVGKNAWSSIKHSYNSGDIDIKTQGDDIQLSTYFGGLVGLNYDSEVVNCYNIGNIDGNNLVGGLIGCNDRFSKIQKCYNSGKVTGKTSVGGLTGYNISEISNCYNTGNIKGSKRTGGLIGHNNTEVANSYNIGKVESGAFSCGGILGHNDSNNTLVVKSFWNKESASHAKNFGGNSKTTIELKTKSTFIEVGWDFAAVWQIDPTINEGYPFLLNLSKF